MKLHSESFVDGGVIPAQYAFGKVDDKHHVTLAENFNPHLAWSDAPQGTRSFAIICHDYDVPSSGEDVNQEGREVPASLPRCDFFHWTLIDLPVSVHAVAKGEYSDGVTPKGKGASVTRHGARQGINDYTAWFSGDQDMAGDYFGYDGPCPPWNDSIVHHYVFTVYALDVEALPLNGRFTGEEARRLIEQHALGRASITGTYTLNPRLAG